MAATTETISESLPRRGRRATRVLLAVALVGVVGTSLVGVVGWRVWSGARTDTVGDLDFANPLHIPDLDDGRVDGDGTRVFEMTADEATTSFRPGEETPTLGYDGTYLGPTLRMQRGEDVEVRVTNDMDEVTTTHWHGMHLPAVADGGPHSPIAPGDTWRPTWTIDQPAATLWYHPHPHGRTEHQVQQGLAGMVIVDDGDPVHDSLPHDYGVDDIPVIVQDRSFSDDGAFTEGSGFLTSIGPLGDELLVNGTWDPHLEVTTERVRLRILNGSAARVYDFGFSDGRTFALVGTDGGLLAAPAHLDHVRLSPGERAEVVVDVEAGERVVLRSDDPDLGQGPLERFQGGDDRFDVLELRAADRLQPSPELPDALAAAPAIEPADSVADRTFRLSDGNRINDRSMDIERIDTVVRAGSVETWTVTAGGPHSFHLHDVQMQVLAVDGGPPPPELAGWKDTVFLPGGTEVRLLIRFGDHASDEVPYMFHCHLLRHEDDGMMGQVLVTDDGTGPDRIDPPAGPDHDHGGG